jgi:PKD repeat protein
MHNIGRQTFQGNWYTGGGGVYQGEGTSHHIYDSNVWHHIGRLYSGHPHDYNHDHALYLKECSNGIIINNIFYGNESGWDIHMDGGMNSWEIINNTFASENHQIGGQILLWIEGQHRNYLIQNNIFFNPKKVGIRNAGVDWDKPDNTSNIMIRNNLVYGGSIIDYMHGITIENNLLNRNPEFADPENFDFHLEPGSYAIDTGFTNGSPEFDHDGNRRPFGSSADIGAYEFNRMSSLKANITTNLSSGIAPFNVQFTGSVSNGTAPYDFTWDFGDNSTSNAQNPSHIFEEPGIYTITLTVMDFKNRRTSATTVIEVTANSNSSVRIVDTKFVEGDNMEELSTITPGNWFDFYIYFDGWEDISYADVWICHISSNEGNVQNRGGRFFTESNYTLSLSISTNEIWAGESESSVSGTNITGKLGLFIDDDNDEYQQNRKEQWAKVRIKLLNNALSGLWTVNAYIKNKNGGLSGLYQKQIEVVSDEYLPAAKILLSESSIIKPQSVTVFLTTSKVVTQVPTPLFFTASDGSNLRIELNGNTPGREFIGNFIIGENVPDGLGRFYLPVNALVDTQGNKGNKIISGIELLVAIKPSPPRNLNVKLLEE